MKVYLRLISQLAKNFTASTLWYRIGIAGVFLLSIALRLWGLSRFNTLVFDEVYYVESAINYLIGTPFFDSHPPLGKYLISISIWISSHLPFGNDTIKQDLTNFSLSSFSYRWLNALTGSLIPLLVSGITYKLSHRWSYSFITSLFVATDGLLLVESRYALINIYLVIFGLLGQFFFNCLR